MSLPDRRPPHYPTWRRAAAVAVGAQLAAFVLPLLLLIAAGWRGSWQAPAWPLVVSLPLVLILAPVIVLGATIVLSSTGEISWFGFGVLLAGNLAYLTAVSHFALCQRAERRAARPPAPVREPDAPQSPPAG